MKPVTLVIALAGLPASGKSSFVDSFCRFLEHSFPGHSQLLLWNYDHVLGTLMRGVSDNSALTLDANYQSFSPEQWTAGRGQILQQLEQALALPQWSSDLGHSEFREFSASLPELVRCAILDDNMYLQSMRKMVRRIARRAGAHYLTLYFDVPLIVALERNEHRNVHVNRLILERMAKNLEPPQGWELSCSLVIGKEPSDLTQAMSHIRHLLFNPPASSTKSLPAGPCAQTQTEGHQQELRLRKHVASTLQRAKGSLAAAQLRQLAAELSKLKKSTAESGQFEEFQVQADLLLLEFLSKQGPTSTE